MDKSIKKYQLKKKEVSNLRSDKFKKIKEYSKQIQNILWDAVRGGKISDLSYFPNLRYVTIQNFYIDDKAIKELEKLSFLDTISFINCRFNYEEKEKIEKIPKTIKFIRCENIPAKLPPIENLCFEQGIVDFDCIDFEALKTLSISYSEIKNAHDLKDKLNIEYIDVFQSKLFNKTEKEIEKIEVSKNTSFANRKKQYECIEDIR